MPRGKPKGSPKTGGRQKGTPNKVTKTLRDDVLEAFKQAGGVKYLLRHAEENPNLFLPLIAKVIPKEINQETEIEVTIRHRYD